MLFCFSLEISEQLCIVDLHLALSMWFYCILVHHVSSHKVNRNDIHLDIAGFDFDCQLSLHSRLIVDCLSFSVCKEEDSLFELLAPRVSLDLIHAGIERREYIASPQIVAQFDSAHRYKFADQLEIWLLQRM